MVTLLPDVEPLIRLHPDGDVLSLKDAKLPAGAFAMRPLNPLHVQQLVESEAEQWPPVLVTLSTHGYILIDGYHRLRAAQIQQREWIKATCQAYPSEHAVIEAAFRANLTHGLKASVQTRGDYAYWLHVSFPDLTQEEIAKRASMTQGAVSKAITKRDQQAKRALQQQQEEESAKVRQQRVKQSCRRFTRFALDFFKQTDDLADEELTHLLTSQLKTPEEREKLVRIGRLLEGPASSSVAETTTGPLRLRQFVGRSFS